MNYSYQQEELADYEGFKYRIFYKNSIRSFKQVIQSWQNDDEFIQFYNQILAHSEFSAFYWEVKPIRLNQLDEAFEFVLINSKPLTLIKANPKAFQAHFSEHKSAVAFENLGKDALLVAPCPITQTEHYRHFGSFAREAPKNQHISFWKLVGHEYMKSLGNAPKWLSTAGLGVYWLHVRIDSRPKYYRYTPYQQIENQ